MKTAHLNLLEKGTVTLTAGTAHADYPLWRLWDRDPGKLFRLTVAGNFTLTVDLTQNNDKLEDGGFENGDFSGWESAGNCSIVATPVKSGTYAASLDVDGALIRSRCFPIDASRVIAVVVHHNITTVNGGSLSIGMLYSDGPACAGTITEHVYELKTALTTGWARSVYYIGPAGSGADFEYPAGIVAGKLNLRRTGDITVYVDACAIHVVDPADRLLIPAGHNLFGQELRVFALDDPASPPGDQVALFKMPEGVPDVSWTRRPALVWWVMGIGLTMAAEMAELHLTETYDWERLPSRPSGPHGLEHNVRNETTAGGQDRAFIHGASRRAYQYQLNGIRPAQRAEFEALDAASLGARPFWLLDHRGEWVYGRLRSPLGFTERAPGVDACALNFLEVLP